MNILITGCNGQLGNEIQLLQAQYAQHTWLNTDVNELDITDKAAIERFVEANEIDGIVNCAAYTAVDKAESDPQLARKLNADAPAFLAEAVAKRGGWMVQVSTDYVFNGTKHTPYVETDEPCPNSIYGQTKLEGEQAVSKLCPNAMIIRTAWLYSEFGNNFVKTMIRLGREREQLGVIFDQVGTPTYAHDLATAIMTAIDKGIKPGVYHFSNEGVTSWYDFTKSIHRLSGINTCQVSPLHTAEYPTPACRPAYSVLDKTKIKAAYGIEIPHWEESLAKCIAKL
ncbi:NAD(P)-dependent oxidoreductase [Prevotella sp. HMSC073D09]|uniref:dTDP-4-dehydrorhamnose reductase n=1 Tax=Prevotella sp. HMSC073D09 TaxID=1739459 RepID=UPI0008A5C95C|nr:dTDP-4-dehydrorhamnose reductase [Prevotella sp. HMSC073D09]OFQ20473.1 NAD(P)-dependent oxidoreductase [Prevotella sp. HMSC073D09]